MMLRKTLALEAQYLILTLLLEIKQNQFKLYRIDYMMIKKKHMLSSIIILSLMSCNQKKMFIQLDSLKEKEIRIYYDVSGYPALPQDSFGNYLVYFDTATILYTSTRFGMTVNHQTVYCFSNKNKKCYYEDHELESDGFVINLSSCFTSDTSKRRPYANSYDRILIERIK